ncbi:nodulation S family protein [Sphingobium sp. AS12]|jgi:SAM-dependent methyltransferase|uniref:SAM-dependent methyltransferase n=1 Tax=Sphingobium sp. AS12 TaxID=2849495 RepID=UPI001C31A698|nr:SAM-dependent methyltransferase [Sphingobium sp. AS12]MBV2148044.1 nodulation S family protein [Sphingobium sp. AS12]
MKRHKTSLGHDYFETMYRGTDDPWDLESSAYERDKYAHSIGALAGRTYELGFEIGCAKGVLTQSLATQCHALLAIDVSETALKAARERCAALDHVSFGRMIFPGRAPIGSAFDLIILSEVAYYWDAHDISRAAQWIATHIAPGGDILLVHWTGETDYPQSGDDAVIKLQAALALAITVITTERMPHYRLDLWRAHA